MDAKLEYQLTPEQAEQLALEAAEIRDESLRERARWAFPALSAVFFGFLGVAVFAPALTRICNFICDFVSIFSVKIYTADSPKPVDQSGPQLEVIITMICIVAFTLIGFVFGKWRQSIVLNKIKLSAREGLNKSGAGRSVTWNEEFLVFKSPLIETKVQWRFLKQCLTGKSGIHLMSDYRTVAFSVPKAALPPNTAVEELIKTWQIRMVKPPILP